MSTNDPHNRPDEFRLRHLIRDREVEVADLQDELSTLGDHIRATRRDVAAELRREHWGHDPLAGAPPHDDQRGDAT